MVVHTKIQIQKSPLYGSLLPYALYFSSGEIPEFSAGHFHRYFIHQQTTDGELQCVVRI